MLRFKANAYIPQNVADWLQKFNLEDGGLVQQAINAAVIRYDIPYVPADTGWLMQSAYAATDLSGTEVVYPGPYAHFQYIGLVRTTEDGRVWANAGEEKPILTDRELVHSTDVNPLAGPYWFERMKADHLDDIIEEAKKVALSKQR